MQKLHSSFARPSSGRRVPARPGREEDDARRRRDVIEKYTVADLFGSDAESDFEDVDIESESDDDETPELDADLKDYARELALRDMAESDEQSDADLSILQRIIQETDEDEDEESYTPNYYDLEEEEHLLPMTYIVSPIEQWLYILDACKSGFKVVQNLGKVNNKTLSLVADAAGMKNERLTAVDLDARQRNALFCRNNVISYARQRNV